jgi:hypothetical protein
MGKNNEKNRETQKSGEAENQRSRKEGNHIKAEKQRG